MATTFTVIEPINEGDPAAVKKELARLQGRLKTQKRNDGYDH